jgi:hypothetical protein
MDQKKANSIKYGILYAFAASVITISTLSIVFLTSTKSSDLPIMAYAQLSENMSQSSYSLDTPFQLKINQTAAIADTNLTIKFLKVLDSRCPSDVECFWAGQVTASFLATSHQNCSTVVNITLGAGSTNATKTFNGFAINLVKVDPYPISTMKTENNAYQSTLIVSKAS